MAWPFTLFAVWLYLTLLAKWLCENGNFQTEGGREGLGLGGVVAATIADNFFSIAKWLCCKRCCTRLNLNDYLTI